MEVSQFGVGARSGVSTDSGSINGDFETFLRMMTTQIQNQDPLSPMEADQFASQLAAFSMVEQQTLTNKLLDGFVSSFGKGGLAEYASLVGRTVVHQSGFEFYGAPIEFEIGDRAESDENAKVVVLDNTGTVIAEIAMSAGQTRATWDGTDAEGQPATTGQYSAVVWRSSDNTILDTPVSTSSVIEEVRFGDRETELLLADGTVIAESSVLKLR